MAEIYRCVLCGIEVGLPSNKSTKLWLRRFRALYRDCYNNVFLSEVGHKDNASPYKVARQPSRPRQAGLYVGTDLVTIPVMHEPEDHDGIHGYIFHESCWMILEKAGESTEFSLERLQSVLESFPLPEEFNGLNWGHDYGGILKFQNESPYSLLDHHVSHPMSISENHKKSLDDPFEKLDLIQMLSFELSGAPGSSVQLGSQPDKFSRMPLEVREMIAINLSTSDALNLRLVSRSFLPIYQSSAFWLSRFHHQRERCFLFEVGESKAIRARDAADLLHLYRLSKSFDLAPRLFNRERVWRLAQSLLRLIKSSVIWRKPAADISSYLQGKRSRIAGMELFWTLRRNWPEFTAGCRPTVEVKLKIPPGAVLIRIFSVNVGACNYVTGIQLRGQDGEEKLAGYAFNDNIVELRVDSICGFRVAAGIGGIRAFQVIGRTGQASRWTGGIEGAAVSDCLIRSTPLEYLQLGLDGFKVTAMEVELGTLDECPPQESIDLRKEALWQTKMPPAGVTLNNESFVSTHPSVAWDPLSWIHFGGTAGDDLPHVRGVTAYTSHGRLRGMRFLYDECHTKCQDDSWGRHLEFERAEATLFPIDGEGGERIEAVFTGSDPSRSDNAPGFVNYQYSHYIRLVTNRGRSECFGKIGTLSSMKEIHIASDTTLTGFYGQWHALHGLISFGVISETTAPSARESTSSQKAH